MKSIATIVLLASTFAFTISNTQAQTPAASQKRAAWTTSRVRGTPEPPLPYTTEPAFPALKFNQCLDITAAPGSNRLFVVEQSGKIFSFVNKSDVAQSDLVIDFAKAIPGVAQVYALAFHPEFEKNHYCYVCYIKADNLPDGSHVSRFTMTTAEPPTIDAASELPLITWLSGGHNGCDLAFGPDGCLYISTGDGTAPNPPDALKTGQDLSDLLSSILRIDVDHPDAGRNYGIPQDNPFVSLTGARGEVWAYGLRNPWRLSFDRKTGDLWVGDVGWELWEMLYRIEKGGNYGWAVMEGRASTNPEWPRGPTPILPPTIDHSHTESSSITEGLTYYGSRLKELHGTHIYGDYDTGKFWGFKFENGKVVDHRELADTTHRFVGATDDASGEMFLLDHTAGTIHRFIPNPQAGTSSTFPRTLSESGLFTSVASHTPATGVVPYSINAEPWMDYATAERFVAVPQDLALAPVGAVFTFPTDSVMVKTLSLEMRMGDPSSTKRIETQILHFDGVEWMPYTYQWNDEQTDATLVPAVGADRVIEVADSDAPGGKRQQTWRFAGRAECQRCHNKWSGPVLGFNAPQLDTASQLDAFATMHLFETPVAEKNRQQLTSPDDKSASIDARARAYLHANCAHCHRLHAGGSVLSHMHFDLPLEKTNMPGARPSQGIFGIPAAQVVAPADPDRSVLLYRMSKLGAGRMPHIGSTEVDRAGIQLIHDWIKQLARPAGKDIAGDETAAQLRVAEAATLSRLKVSPSPDQSRTLVEQLLSSTSGAMLLLRTVDSRELPEPVRLQVIEVAAQHPEIAVRDLFERFLPSEQRIKRLGSVIRPEQILSLAGDAQRGRKVYFETAGVSCKNCHRIEKEGAEVGPELTLISRRLGRAELLESILEPSKRIDPKYVTWAAETSDGRIRSGLLVSKDEQEVVLRDAENKLVRIPLNTVEQLVPQRQSLMPELLFRDMTAQQAADLVEFLGTLK